MGNSIVGALEHRRQKHDLATDLGNRIGADLDDPTSRDVLMRAAEAQLDQDATVDTRRSAAEDYLRLAGASEQDVGAALSLYDENLFRGIRTYPIDDISAQTTTVDAERAPAFGSWAVDDAVIGAGRVAESVGQAVGENPGLAYALVALDVAAGPAAFAVRQAILATPVGDMLQTAEGAALDYLTDRFERAGYNDLDATRGGAGALSVGLLGAVGAAGALKGIQKAGLAARLSARQFRSGMKQYANNVGDSRLVPRAGEDVHHMVPHGDPRAPFAQKRLEDLGIDIHDPAVNGVPLPRSVDSPNPMGKTTHNTTQTDAYHQYIEDSFKTIQTRPQAIDFLKSLREQLLVGKMPWQTGG